MLPTIGPAIHAFLVEGFGVVVEVADGEEDCVVEGSGEEAIEVLEPLGGDVAMGVVDEGVGEGEEGVVEATEACNSGTVCVAAQFPPDHVGQHW